MKRAAGNRPMAILIAGPLLGCAAYSPAQVRPREEAQPFFNDHWVGRMHASIGTLSPRSDAQQSGCRRGPPLGGRMSLRSDHVRHTVPWNMRNRPDTPTTARLRCPLDDAKLFRYRLRKLNATN